MPELPVGDETGAFSADDLLRVYAYMAHPRSEISRLQFLARMTEQVVAHVQPVLEERYPADLASAVLGAQLGRWLQPLGGFPRLTTAPSAERVGDRLVESVWPGSVAGDVLTYLHRMEVSGFKPSVNKAVAISVRYLTRAVDLRGATGGRSPRYVREQWEAFKPSVHLWAAYRAWLAEMEGDISLPPPVSEEGLPLFLALAEWFAERGLNMFAHGQKMPTLNPSELWRVPQHVRLPTLQIQELPLPEWALEVVRSYRRTED